MKRLDIFVLLAALALSGCYIPEQLDTQERELRTLRSQSSTSRSELDDLRANMADMRANIDQMHRDIRALQDQVEEVRYQFDRRIGQVQSSREGDPRLKDMEARVAKLEEELKAQTRQLKSREDELAKMKEQDAAKEKAAVESTAAKKDYDEALRLVERKDYRAAMPRLNDFLKKYPDSTLADNAQYWLAECYYGLKEYDRAILEFDNVRRRFPKSDKIPASLLRQGFAFAELGDKVDARLILQELVERFPESEEAGKAKQRLKSLDAPPARTPSAR